MEDAAGKELELLKTAAPQAIRIAILTNPTNPAHDKELRGAQEAAGALKVELLPIEVRGPREIDNAFATVKRAGVGSLVVFADPLFSAEASRIADLAASQKVPSICGFREHVTAGGLMSYGPEIKDSYRRAAGAADRPCHINPRNRRMRVRRTHETCIGLAREAEVVGVLAAAGQQSRVLAPRHRFSDAPRGKRLA